MPLVRLLARTEKGIRSSTCWCLIGGLVTKLLGFYLNWSRSLRMLKTQCRNLAAILTCNIPATNRTPRLHTSRPPT